MTFLPANSILSLTPTLSLGEIPWRTQVRQVGRLHTAYSLANASDEKHTDKAHTVPNKLASVRKIPFFHFLCFMTLFLTVL